MINITEAKENDFPYVYGHVYLFDENRWYPGRIKSGTCPWNETGIITPESNFKINVDVFRQHWVPMTNGIFQPLSENLLYEQPNMSGEPWFYSFLIKTITYHNDTTKVVFNNPNQIEKHYSQIIPTHIPKPYNYGHVYLAKEKIWRPGRRKYFTQTIEYLRGDDYTWLSVKQKDSFQPLYKYVPYKSCDDKICLDNCWSSIPIIQWHTHACLADVWLNYFSVEPNYIPPNYPFYKNTASKVEHQNDQEKPNMETTKIIIVRLKPHTYNNIIISGYLETIPTPTSIPDIIDHIGKCYGGGKYAIKAIKEDNTMKEQVVEISGNPILPALPSSPKADLRPVPATPLLSYLAQSLDTQSKENPMNEQIAEPTKAAEPSKANEPSKIAEPSEAAEPKKMDNSLWASKAETAQQDSMTLAHIAVDADTTCAHLRMQSILVNKINQRTNEIQAIQKTLELSTNSVKELSPQKPINKLPPIVIGFTWVEMVSAFGIGIGIPIILILCGWL